jgi:hypothetical protein
MKEIGITPWLDPDTGATSESGFIIFFTVVLRWFSST